jgi:hypothetical protein
LNLHDAVANFREHKDPYLPIRRLGSRFRRGETLTRLELYQLLRYAEDSGNYLLIRMVKDELRGRKRVMSVNAVTKQGPSKRGGIVIVSGWKNRSR